MSQDWGLGKSQVFDTAERWVIFPWTGTCSARTIQYWLQACGFEVEFPMMMFPWVMTVAKANSSETKIQFLNRLKDVVTSSQELKDVVRKIPIEILRTHKFDEYLLDELIRARAGQEWLDWEQAKLDLQKIISS
jgi:hypothetical protein